MLNLCRYMYLSDVPLLLCCELFSWITNKLVEKTLLLPLKLNTGVSHVQQRKKSSLRAKTEGVFLIVTNTNNSGLIFQKQTECITFSIPRAFFFQRFNLKMIFISLIKVIKKNKLIFRALHVFETNSNFRSIEITVSSDALSLDGDKLYFYRTKNKTHKCSLPFDANPSFKQWSKVEFIGWQPTLQNRKRNRIW